MLISCSPAVSRLQIVDDVMKKLSERHPYYTLNIGYKMKKRNEASPNHKASGDSGTSRGGICPPG
jgi:hypothetical protein